MIYLYSGTPGSGKSLHMAMNIYWWVRAGKPCICNFAIASNKIKHSKQQEFYFVPDEKLTPSYLIDFGMEYTKKKGRVKEGSIMLVIDEAQRLFNARDWGQRGRGEWNTFFQLHRHLGYDVYLIAQYDRMLDRQIRALVEY
ncbi:MAG: zonular occludens toxin domain-containing protein, partial [Lachnospiraceae bacterium]